MLFSAKNDHGKVLGFRVIVLHAISSTCQGKKCIDFHPFLGGVSVTLENKWTSDNLSTNFMYNCSCYISIDLSCAKLLVQFQFVYCKVNTANLGQHGGDRQNLLRSLVRCQNCETWFQTKLGITNHINKIIKLTYNFTGSQNICSPFKMVCYNLLTQVVSKLKLLAEDSSWLCQQSAINKPT
jgi:hypothetical protein